MVPVRVSLSRAEQYHGVTDLGLTLTILAHATPARVEGALRIIADGM